MGGAVTYPAPQRPKGPKSAIVGQEVKFVTTGLDPLNVHLFQWDWGDGTVSQWRVDGEIGKHKYGKAGTFSVRVREKCPLGAFISGWSKSATISVSPSG